MRDAALHMIDLRVFEAMPVSSMLVAPDAPEFTIIAATDSMIRQSGLSRSRLVNKSFFDPFPSNPANPDSHKEVQSLLYNSFDHVIKTQTRHELPIFRYDLSDESGHFTERYWKVSNQPVVDGEGNLLHILHTSEDVTAVLQSQRREELVRVVEQEQALFKNTKQQLEQSHQRFEAAIAAIHGILWTNDAQGQMEGQQTGWSNLTGQSLEQYQGVGWTSAIHPEDAEPTLTAWKLAVREQRTFMFQHRVRKKDGNYGVFLVRSIPVLNAAGEVREWVGVHTEITEQQKAAEQLRESEARFRNLADDSPMFVFIIEPGDNAVVSYWNKTWLNYTGRTVDQAIGRAWDGIIHPEDVPVVMHYYTPAFEQKTAYVIPAVRVRRQDGVFRWHTFKGNPRYKEGGAFNGYVGVGFDIHDQKLAEDALRESQTRALLAIEAAQLGTFEVELGDNDLKSSERTREIFGFDSASRPTYADLIAAVHPLDRPIRERAHAQAMQSGKLVFETRITTPSGVLRYIRVNAKYPSSVTAGLLIGTVIDITEEKLAAEELERKIEERTRELKLANDQLKQFSYAASHDLKEPLRKISLYVDKLIKALGPALSEDNRQMADRILVTTGRMRTLIEDLLAYSNTTLGTTQPEPVDLRELLIAVIDDLEMQVSDRQAKIIFKDLPIVHGDPRQLRQLMQNLIGNSLKYSRSGVVPEVYVTGMQRPNRGVLPGLPEDQLVQVIEVRDNGIGFDPAHAQRIFRLFQRLHGKGQFEGTGVGLAIVQKVVENHHGIIVAEGVPDQGAVFTVYLPAATVPSLFK